MRSILPSSKKQNRFSEQSNKLTDEGKTIENSFDIAETLNNYFVKVGKTLADEILPTSVQTCKKYLRNRIRNSIFLDEPRPNEIYNIINSLKCKNSSKEKVIPSYFIRVAGHL